MESYGGPGALIPNIPSSRASSAAESARGSVSFFNRVNESLDMDVYTFSPGVSVEFSHDWFYASAAAGVTMNTPAIMTVKSSLCCRMAATLRLLVIISSPRCSKRACAITSLLVPILINSEE